MIGPCPVRPLAPLTALATPGMIASVSPAPTTCPGLNSPPATCCAPSIPAWVAAAPAIRPATPAARPAGIN